MTRRALRAILLAGSALLAAGGAARAAGEGAMCGGIAGILCDDGLTCRMTDEARNSADGAGTCALPHYTQPGRGPPVRIDPGSGNGSGGDRDTVEDSAEDMMDDIIEDATRNAN